MLDLKEGLLILKNILEICGVNTMARDLKNNFYRTLNLDKEGKLALKWFRENVKSIRDNADKKAEIKKEEK
jgi:hypothetical protein